MDIILHLKKKFTLFMLIVTLLFIGAFGNNTVSASNLNSTSPEIEYHEQEPSTEIQESVPEDFFEPLPPSTRPELDIENPDGEIGTFEYYTVTTEYGAAIRRSDVTLSSVAPVDVYRNSSSLSVLYKQTHKVTFKSSWNASAGVSINIPRLNTALGGQIGVTGSKSYEFSRTFSVTVPSGKGIQIKKLYRKYEVPTYKVTTYSGSMAAPKTRQLVGNTVVYVPIGLNSYDY